MKDFNEFINITEENKNILINAHIDEFNRLLKEFKDSQENENFGGELYRIALISSMASINTTMSLLKNYHSWLNQK